MSELGTKLREARVEKGYTLNTLQQMTKIQKKYLQAIELGNYDEMPGSFYVRAFIKQYADMVGLDGDELLIEYEDELSSSSDNSNDSEDVEGDKIPSRAERYVTNENNSFDAVVAYLPVILLVAIVIGIMIALVFAINSIGQNDQPAESVSSETTSIVSVVEPESVEQDEPATESDAESETTTEEPALGENDIMVGDQVLTLTSQPGEATTYELNAPFSEYTFEFEGNNFVWVGVFEDGVIVQDTTIVEDEVLEHTVTPGTQEVRISFGYPEGANLSVNGTLIEPQGQYLTETMIFTAAEDSGVETEDDAIELDIPEEDATTSEEDFQGPAVLAPEDGTEGAE
ncbi:helix-turn-helix domain-containing protein [Ruoffia sp. FAM 26255]|uniref:helix-turn-helix domain-containing protein n=1 Tax=Ruoffia sp. FAM 26255 TaxID=3259519 RepID=UPI00388A4352